MYGVPNHETCKNGTEHFDFVYKYISFIRAHVFIMKNAVCVICSDLFDSFNDVAVAKCGHVFHTSCLEQWLVKVGLN